MNRSMHEPTFWILTALVETSRSYRLTEYGTAALTAETAHLERTARTAKRLLAARPSFGQVMFG